MKEPYPLRILPKVSYKEIHIDDYFKKFFLLRQINTKENYRSRKNLCKALPQLLRTSTFANGISVNLLSVFRKEDIRLSLDKTVGYYDAWTIGLPVTIPADRDIHFQSKHFVGFKISDLMQYQSQFPIRKSNGNLLRYDSLFFYIKHEPTKGNYWHFDIFFCGINSVTGGKYMLSDEFNGRKIKKIADNIMDDICDMVRLESSTYPCYLEKRRYMVR